MNLTLSVESCGPLHFQVTNMDDMETLHHNLYTAIDNQNTEESLSIIRSLIHCQEFNHGGVGNFLDRYSHRTQAPLTPLIHSIVKENATVANFLLENGCCPNIKYINNNRKPFTGDKRSNKCFDFFFKVIGKPFFKLVVMTILEASNEVIIDKNGNTVLHVICQKKLTSWLEVVLNSPSQRNLLSYSNKKGYLPMHVAAKYNFLEYFELVFNQETVVNNSIEDKGRIVLEKRNVLEEYFNEADDNDVTSKSLDLAQMLPAEEKYEIEQSMKDGKGDISYMDSAGTCVGSNKRSTICKSKSKSVNKSVMNCCRFEYETDINAPIDRTGVTVLHIAAQHRYCELVKCLTKNGADVTLVDLRKHSSLVICLNSVINVDDVERINPDFVDVCRTLIAAGAPVNGYYHYGINPSRNTSRFRKVNIDDDLVTPLHIAAEIGCQDVIQLLLNNGADPKARSRNLGKLPVQIALEKGHTEGAHILLTQRLYPERFLVSFADKCSNSLLHSASNCSEKIVNNLVLDYESCLDKPNLNNVFPLDKAIFYGNIPYIQAILSCRPGLVNICHQQFRTSPPLHRAASSPLNHLPLCQILLSYGANIYAKAYDKKNMAYRRALRSDCYENAVYLCERMSHPFTIAEREELLDFGKNRMDCELSLRLMRRLENIPSLLLHCLDAVRLALIGNCHSFQSADNLPIPCKMLRALKYQDMDQCLS